MDNEPRIRVLHLMASPDIGGAERLLLILANSIDKKKFSLILGIFVDRCTNEEPLWIEAEKLGVKLGAINFKKPYDLKQLSDIYCMIREYRPHIIHAHGYKTNIIGFVFSKLFNIPIIATIHGHLHAKRRVTRMLYGINIKILRYFNRIIAVSEEIKSRLVHFKIASERIVVIKNVPTPFSVVRTDKSAMKCELGMSPTSKIIGFIGRLEKVKGISQFIDAAISILQRTSDVNFIIIGEGSQREMLENHVRSLGLDKHICFLGFIGNPADYFNLFDLYVLSSLDEGVPLTLLEAMYLGVPVVATNVGGVPEVIQSGMNGILVPPNNLERMVDAIMSVLGNKINVSSMINKAKLDVSDNYSDAQWVKMIEKEYNLLSDINQVVI